MEGERGEPDRVLQDSWTVAKNPWLVDLAIGSGTTGAVGSGGPRFLPVELSEAALAGPKAVDPVDQRIEIALPGGVAVRVGRGFDAEALHRVLTVLGR